MRDPGVTEAPGVDHAPRSEGAPAAERRVQETELVAVYFRFVLSHRAFVVGVIGVLTAISLWSASHGVVASSLEKMFFGDSPAYTRYVERIEQFGTEEVNAFGFEEARPLDPEALNRLERLVDRLDDHPEIDRVYSLLDAQEIRSDATTLSIERYSERARRSPTESPEILEALCSDRFAAGLVIAADGGSTALMVEIKPDSNRPAEALPALRQAIMDAFEAEGFSLDDVRSAGTMVNINASVEATNYSIQRIFPYVIVVLLFAVWLMFRRLWPALMSSIVSLIAVAWTIGFAVFIENEINVMISLVPVVILVVGFSDVVHLCSAYLLELGNGLSKDDAILRSAEDVGRACVFTSATTFVGFVCLSFVPTPMFRVMGVVLGFGVAVALLLAMTLVPVLFSWMPEPKPLRGGATSVVQRGIDKVLASAQHISTRWPWVVIAVFAVVTGLSVYGASGIRIEADFAQRMSPQSDLRQDLDWFTEEFRGTSALDVIVSVPERNGLLDADTFRQIAEFQAQLESMASVHQAISLVDLMKDLYAAYAPDRAAADPIPGSRAALSQLLALFESGNGRDLDRMVDFNRQTMRITLRMAQDGVTAHSLAGEEIRAIADRMLGAEIEVEVSGLLYLLGDWVREIVAGQQLGLSVSFVLITLMMWVALGDPRVAMVSMFPNVFPLLVLLGYVGGTWDYVDSDTLAVALLAIGIGVDDTIHFLVRFRVEQERTADTQKALGRTFAFAGRAIVMTTLILGLGFAPFITSDYYSTRMMGVLLPLCLFVAVVADLLLVPAMAKVGWIQFLKGSD